MDVRLLSPDEYRLLENIPAEQRERLTPENSAVAGAFDDGGRLVGSMLLITVPHMECPWIDPQYRGGTLFARMEDVLVNKLRSLGSGKVFVFPVFQKMEQYLLRWGYRLRGTVWEKEI